jgi:hypothetical protein
MTADVAVDLVADQATLIDTIHEQVPGDIAVIVIDTLNRAMFGNENESKDVGQFIRAADAVRMALRALGIFASYRLRNCGAPSTRARRTKNSDTISRSKLRSSALECAILPWSP